MKLGQARITQAIQCLDKSGEKALGQHLAQLLQTQSLPTRWSIAGELSLGKRSDDDDITGTTSQRQALRALLLCQRVLFSNLWAKTNRLPQSWKTTSVNHWMGKSEAAILSAIKTFTATSSTPADAAGVAYTHKNNASSLYDLTLTRKSGNFPIHGTCYMAVMSWLFLSGLVSYRWMLKHLAPDDKPTLLAAFGAGEEIWGQGKAFTENDTLPDVPRGYIVHFYDLYSYRGHWLISNGDGTACGCNNGEEDGKVERTYSNKCNLNSQFMDFKWQIYDSATSLKYDKPRAIPGIAEMIDPTRIPNRDKGGI